MLLTSLLLTAVLLAALSAARSASSGEGALSSMPSTRRSEDVVPGLTSEEGYSLIRLNPYNHKLVYFYASKTQPDSQRYSEAVSEVKVGIMR